MQLNNRPGQVIAAKSSRAVTSITSGEKGETISVKPVVMVKAAFFHSIVFLKGKI